MAALAYVRTLPRGTEFTQALFLVLNHLAETDPAKALALAGELANSRQEQMIYASLFAKLTERDVATAIRRLNEVPAGEAHDHALRAVGSTWAQKDLAAALAWGQGISRPEERALAIESVLATLVPTDPLRAIQLGQKWLAADNLDRILTPALRKLTETDPSDAALIVAALPPGQTQTLAAPEVARQLASGDAAKAIAWVKTLPEATQRVAFNNVLEGWGTADPAAAGRYVTEMSAGPAKTAAAVYLARVLGASAPSAAIAWSQTLGEAALINSAQVTLASAWAQRDAAAASQWSATLPSGSTQAEALNGALSYWVLQDVRGAREFVQNLGPAQQTSAAATLAPYLAQSDPAGAMAWAESLRSTAARDAATTAAYQRWFDNAPDAARAWLAAVNLPDDVRAKFGQAAEVGRSLRDRRVRFRLVAVEFVARVIDPFGQTEGPPISERPGFDGAMPRSRRPEVDGHLRAESPKSWSNLLSAESAGSESSPYLRIDRRGCASVQLLS